uniref:Uncharacterized protein n=1 Tax=Knipowitschia caucasica TaxID=637954 RepID=A0AAV2J8S9_KNICA
MTYHCVKTDLSDDLRDDLSDDLSDDLRDDLREELCDWTVRMCGPMTWSKAVLVLCLLRSACCDEGPALNDPGGVGILTLVLDVCAPAEV